MWFDWNATLYGNRTDNDQVKTYHNSTSGAAFCGPGNVGNNISGCVGDRRGYLLDTVGIDVNNTTRFNVGDWRNALTYGFDAFQDDVKTFDSRGNSNITTPSGQRTVSGGLRAVEEQLLDLARDRQFDSLRSVRPGLGQCIVRRRPVLSKDHGRRDAGGGLYPPCQLR